jgi:hypothetical protein
VSNIKWGRIVIILYKVFFLVYSLHFGQVERKAIRLRTCHYSFLVCVGLICHTFAALQGRVRVTYLNLTNILHACLIRVKRTVQVAKLSGL